MSLYARQLECLRSLAKELDEVFEGDEAELRQGTLSVSKEDIYIWLELHHYGMEWDGGQSTIRSTASEEGVVSFIKEKKRES